MGTAMTVRGRVDGSELGTTLMHEHLLIDFRCRHTGSKDDDLVGRHLTLGDRWKLVKEPARYEANLLRQDVAVAIEEVTPFLAAGGRTVVDVTSHGLGPNPVGLRQIANQTGLNVIASTGLYAHVSHTESVCRASAVELADTMIRELTQPDDDGIQKGFIGEIGVDGPTPCELNAVRGAAIAQRETGAPVSIHLLAGALPEARADALSVVDEFIATGGDPRLLIICHSDGSGTDSAYQDRLLQLGAVLEYDTFGFESVFAYQGGFVQMPTDTQRIMEVADLWERGWGHQVVLSQDVCYRMMSREWGGWGIAHILESLPDRFGAAGLGRTELDVMLIDTPRRLLAFT